MTGCPDCSQTIRSSGGMKLRSFWSSSYHSHHRLYSEAVLVASYFQQPGLNDWSGIIEEWNEKIPAIYLMKTWSRALRTSDRAEGSPSNKLMKLSTTQGDLGTTLNVFGRPRQSPETFLGGPENIFLWTRMSEHPTIQACGACNILHKTPGGCNSWVKAIPANRSRVRVLKCSLTTC